MIKNINFNDFIIPEESENWNKVRYYDSENYNHFLVGSENNNKSKRNRIPSNQVRVIKPCSGVCVMKIDLEFDNLDNPLLSFESQRLLQTKIFCYFDILCNYFKYVHVVRSNQINFSYRNKQTSKRRNKSKAKKRRRSAKNDDRIESLKCTYYCYSYYGNERKLRESENPGIARKKKRKVLNQLIILSFLLILKLHQDQNSLRFGTNEKNKSKNSATHKLILPKIVIKIGYFKKLALVTNPKHQSFLFSLDPTSPSFKKKFDFDLSLPSSERSDPNVIIVDNYVYKETYEYFDYSFMINSNQNETYFFSKLLKKKKSLILNTSLIDLFDEFYLYTSQPKKEMKGDQSSKNKDDEDGDNKDDEEQDQQQDQQQAKDEINFSLIPKDCDPLPSTSIKDGRLIREMFLDDDNNNGDYDDDEYYSDTDSDTSFGHIIKNSRKEKEEKKNNNNNSNSKNNNKNSNDSSHSIDLGENEGEAMFDPEELKKIKLLFHNKQDFHKTLYPIPTVIDNERNIEEEEEEEEFGGVFRNHHLVDSMDEKYFGESVLYRRKRRGRKKLVYPFCCCFNPVNFYVYCCCCFCSLSNLYTFFCVNDILAYYKYNSIKKIQKKKYENEFNPFYHKNNKSNNKKKKKKKNRFMEYLDFYYYNYWYFRPFNVLTNLGLAQKVILKFEYLGLILIKSIVMNMLISLYFIGFFFFILYSERDGDDDERLEKNGSVTRISVNSFMIYNYTNIGVQILYGLIVYLFLSSSMFHKLIIWCCCCCCTMVKGVFRMHSIVKILRKIMLRVMILVYPFLQMTMYLVLLITLFFSNNLVVDDDEGYNNPNLTIHFFMEFLFLLFYLEILQGQVNHFCIHLKFIQMFVIFIPLKFLFYLFLYFYYFSHQQTLSTTTSELFFLREFRYFWWEQVFGYYFLWFLVGVVLLEMIKVTRWGYRQTIHEIEDETRRFQMIQNEILVNLVGIPMENFSSSSSLSIDQSSIHDEKINERKNKRNHYNNNNNKEKDKKKKDDDVRKPKIDGDGNSSNSMISRIMDFEIQQILGSSCESFLDSKHHDNSSLFIKQKERNIRMGYIHLQIDKVLEKKMSLISDLKKNIVSFPKARLGINNQNSVQVDRFRKILVQYKEEKQNVTELLSSIVTFFDRIESFLKSSQKTRGYEIEVLKGVGERNSEIVFFSKYLNFNLMVEMSVQIVHLFHEFKFLTQGDSTITTTTTDDGDDDDNKKKNKNEILKDDMFLKIALVKSAGLEFNFIQSGGHLEHLRYDVFGSGFSVLNRLMNKGQELIQKNAKKKYSYKLTSNNKLDHSSNNDNNNNNAAIMCFKGDYVGAEMDEGLFFFSELNDAGKRSRIRSDVFFEDDDKPVIQEEIVVIGEEKVDDDDKQVVVIKVNPVF